MPQIPTAWNYTLTRAREDRSSRRAGTPADGIAAHQLVGVDSNVLGGLRPHYGFRLVHTLCQATTDNDPSSAAPEDVPTTAKIHDCFGVCFKVSQTDSGYGFVYRTRDPATNQVTVGLEYRLQSDPDQWIYHRLKSYLSSTDVLEQMDVTYWGRFVIVGIKGRRMTLFYLDDDTLEPIVVTNPGPGKAPTLLGPDQANFIGGLTGLVDDDAPAHGQVLLTDTKPSDHDAGIFTTTPEGQADEDIRTISAGQYSFAYRLYDSATARFSALSAIAPVQAQDFATVFNADSGDPTDTTAVNASHYAALELIWDITKFPLATTYVYFYRSARIEDMGPVFYASILHPDALVKLSDIVTDDQPASLNLMRAIWWYTLQDKELVFQLPFNDASTFEPEVPYAGCCLYHEGVLMLSAISGPFDVQFIGQGPIRNMGEIRYSSLVEVSPELFPPGNRRLPQVPTNEVVRFIEAGGSVIGFSHDRQYHCRRESIYIRFEEMHRGYGLVNNRAACSVGNFIYFVTARGAKSIDVQGNLEALQAFDDIIAREWVTQLSGISMAYDSQAAVMYILNPAVDRAALVFFNTSSPGELYDLPFDLCFEGYFPEDTDDSSSTLVERAFFLGHQTDAFAATAGTLNRRIYAPDYDRSKVINGASAGNAAALSSMLETAGDHRFTISVISTHTLTLTADGISTVGGNIQGATAYVLSGARQGQKSRIKSVNTGARTIVVEDGTQFAVGDRIGVSPVCVRWTGSALAMKDESGQEFGSDHFHMRLLNELRPNFSAVSGRAADSVDAQYLAHCYVGNEDTASYSARPTSVQPGVSICTVQNGPAPNAAGFGKTSTQSIALGRSDAAHGVSDPSLFPGIQIACPDLDFTVLGVLATGMVDLAETAKERAG